jgi:hypothetical protein
MHQRRFLSFEPGKFASKWIFSLPFFLFPTDFEEAQQQQLKQQQMAAKGNGNNNGNQHWPVEQQFAQWNLNN